MRVRAELADHVQPRREGPGPVRDARRATGRRLLPGGIDLSDGRKRDDADGDCYGKTVSVSGGGNTDRYPRSVQVFASDKQKIKLHPTQKPLALCEYMIRTYTNEGDLVLDNAMGSGTTGVAAFNLGREFVGIEKSYRWFDVARRRIYEAAGIP